MTFKERLLGDLLTFQRGFDITKEQQSAGTVPIVSSSGVTSFHTESKVKGPGVVIGRKGSLGTVHYIEEDFWPHDTTLWIKAFKGNHPRFLSYFLEKLHLESFDSGSSNPTLNRNHLHKIKVRCPDAEVQKKIAAIVSAYDDLIANNQRRVALLETIAEEIYREWFVRMRPAGATTPDARRAMRKRWAGRKLPEVASITYGFPFAGDRFNTVGLGRPIVRIRDVLSGNSDDYTDEVAHDKYIVRAGDLLIGMDGEFHINHWVGEDAYLVQRVCKIAAKTSYLRAYLFHALRAPIRYYQETIVGATVGHLGAKHLNAIDIVVPDESFNPNLERLNALLDQRLVLARQSNVLASVRDRLLTRLISGKLKVDHLDIRIPPRMRAVTPA